MQEAEQLTNKKMILLLLVLLIIIVAEVCAIAIISFNNSSGGSMSHKVLAPEVLLSYCSSNDLEIHEYGMETYGEDMNWKYSIVCEEKIMEDGEWIMNVSSADDLPSYKNDVFSVRYIKFKKPASEVEEIAIFKDAKITEYYESLVDTESYKKFYREKDGWNYLDGANYVLLDEDVYIEIDAKNNKSARDFLISVGYPDDKWGRDKQ